MGAVDDETRRLAKVIDHPIRARIIELLGERGPLGWKELSAELGVKTGSLYHHLDTLEGLVERDQSKKYFLTKSGRIVYSRTSQSRSLEAVHRASLDLRKEGGARRAAASIFVPRALLTSALRTRGLSAATLVSVAAVITLGVGLAGFSPNLYYLRPDPGLTPTVGGFAASLAVLVVAGFACARFLFKAGVDMLSLAAATAFSFIPVFAFSSFILLPPASAFFTSSTAAFTLCLVFFQTWSSAIFGAGLSVASGLRIERALLVSLAVLYATMVLMLIQGKAL